MMKLDAIDNAALLLLDDLAARIRDGSVVVTSLGCVDDADAMSLALNWKLPASATTSPASAPATIEPQGCCAKPKLTPLPDGSTVCLSCGVEVESEDGQDPRT